MERYGQTATGLVEDAVVFGTGLAVANPELTGTKALLPAR